MTGRNPFKIEILVADGRPDGLRLVEKSNWIGQGIVCPRGRYSWAKKERAELSRCGVYLLVGQDGDPLPKLYVGEAEEVKTRLDRHYADNHFDFWQQAIVFTTKGTPLNKAEVKYLEARLLRLARKYGRSKLQNTNKPRLPGLSEADQAKMQGYLDELLSLLPVLGVPFFEAPTRDREFYHVDRSGCKAAGFETNTGFTVRKGSLARKSTVPSMKERARPYYLQRQELIKEGVLEKKTGHYRFTRDWLFNSPSAAAAVCLGSSANGLVEWKDESGTTLKANREKATA